ncbi:unnamed protein product [Boreogadus saida]
MEERRQKSLLYPHCSLLRPHRGPHRALQNPDPRDPHWALQNPGHRGPHWALQTPGTLTGPSRTQTPGALTGPSRTQDTGALTGPSRTQDIGALAGPSRPRTQGETSLSVCADGWLNLSSLIAQCSSAVQPHPAPESSQGPPGAVMTSPYEANSAKDLRFDTLPIKALRAVGAAPPAAGSRAHSSGEGGAQHRGARRAEQGSGARSTGELGAQNRGAGST